MPARKVLTYLHSLKNPTNVKGMKRFGIQGKNLLGISIPTLRSIAKGIGKDHVLAANLWASGVHEARLLAAFIDDPKLVTKNQMDNWVHDFDSWDVCDQVCGNLFDRTRFAHSKIKQWVRSEKEYTRRAGFAMMATMVVHDKKASDRTFRHFFPLIERYAYDDRNFVKKAANWALRQIGKRNEALRLHAIACAHRILKQDTPSARWIANGALRELNDTKIIAMVSKRQSTTSSTSVPSRRLYS